MNSITTLLKNTLTLNCYLLTQTVLFSSTVNEVTNTISSQFFSYEKCLSAEKAPNDSHPLRSFCARRKYCFCCFVLLIFVSIADFWL